MVMISKKRKKKHKPVWYVITSIFLIIAFYVTIGFGKSIYEICRLSWMKHNEEKAFNQAVKEKELLELEIKKLTTDSLYIEEIAREEYGMIKDGEEIFHITRPDSSSDGEKDAD